MERSYIRSEVLIAVMMIMMMTEVFYNAPSCILVSIVTEDEDTTLLQYVDEYLAVGMATSQKT